MGESIKKQTRIRDTSQKRESILNGAVQTFLVEGYRNASMDRIAEHAGASKRTVYNHFPKGKDELLQAVIERLLAEKEKRKKIVYSHSRTLEEQLAKFANAELHFLTKPDYLAQVRMLAISLMSDPVLKARISEKTKGRLGSPHKKLIDWLKEAQKDGRIISENPPTIARIFYAMIEGGLVWPALFQPCQSMRMFRPFRDELIKTFLIRFRRT